MSTNSNPFSNTIHNLYSMMFVKKYVLYKRTNISHGGSKTNKIVDRCNSIHIYIYINKIGV